MSKTKRIGRPEKSKQEKVVKITISLPPEYLNWIDRASAANGGNRSRTITSLLRPKYEARKTT